MNIHQKNIDYWESIKEYLLTLFGDISFDDKKDELVNWVRHWSNGGGMMSMAEELRILLDTNDSLASFLTGVEDSPFFEAGTALLFADIIEPMIEEVFGNESIDDKKGLSMQES